ncbi:MAG: transcriptional regulator [Alphaproteobacteria bacterium RIFCSPHIGHO2_12_FULL_66_14]|jgi:MerR family mercuric resistance operon transcriptional regulator|nr:MAG: transcriptional regulator [Alphaproteobacteria bacterium RIFCSPHIGHO2_12_FULL_66_14]
MNSSRKAALSIGALSKRSRVNIETIRYYERIGLLPRPARSDGGYRLFGSADADRLGFVRRARDLGFSLDEIRQLLGLAAGTSRSCRRVHDMARLHLADVLAKIADLQRMAGALDGLVRACAGGTMPHCPLLETLAHDNES